MVECQLPKLNVAGSNPVTRLKIIEERSSSRLDELHNLRTDRSSSTFVAQGLKNQGPCFIGHACFSLQACFFKELYGSSFMVLS